MQTITTIGLDIAKSVFQVHGVDAAGQVVIRRQLKRRYVLEFFQKLPPCLIGIEACASSHHWSRELQAIGHTVRLMPPAYVKPYVKRQKNDATDAEAICEAVTRPNMRFVPTKTAEQQSCLTLHRTRHLLMRQQTSVINAIRAHLAEFGIVAPVGRNGVEQLLRVVADSKDSRLPEIARACVAVLGAQLQMLKAQILDSDRMIRASHRSNEASMRLDEIPGVGQYWPLLWLPVLPSQRRSDQAATSRPGSGSCQSRTSSRSRGSRGDDMISYFSRVADCRDCPLKSRCCPKSPSRKITRHIYEAARDVARAIAKTPAYEQTRRDRKKVEMLFAHLKRILRLGRLRLRGPAGAQFEFTLAAIAQNLRRIAKLTLHPPNRAAACVA